MTSAVHTILDWLRHRPLAAVWGRECVRVAAPEAVFRVSREPAEGVRSRWIENGAVAPAPVPFVHDPILDLDAVLRWGRASAAISSAGDVPGGWIGMLSYDLGRMIEPAVEHPTGHAQPDRPWPLIELAWCPDVAVIERAAGIGGPAPRREFTIGALRCGTAREGFLASVERAIEYIRAGDVFQVNLAHRLSSTFEGSTRSLFAAMCAAADPWHGAYLEMSDVRAGLPLGVADPTSNVPRALVSSSPELFLRVVRVGERWHVVTRPMKGTRPASGDPEELNDSAKDRAELNMIIDLMRNDLGRVCRAGSVRVEHAREIERHGGDSGVWQATATVGGELRDGIGPAHLLAAAFPAGSVTGAPKIRAMQIIDDLEPVRRARTAGAWGGSATTARWN